MHKDSKFTYKWACSNLLAPEKCNSLQARTIGPLDDGARKSAAVEAIVVPVVSLARVSAVQHYRLC